MKTPGFIFGPGTSAATPEQLKAQRQIAEAMMKRNRAPQNVGEGLDAASRSIMGALLARNADKKDAKARKDASSAYDGLFGTSEGASAYDSFFGSSGGGGYGGGGYMPAPQQPWAPTPAEANEILLGARPTPDLTFGGMQGGIDPLYTPSAAGLDMGLGADTSIGAAGMDTLTGAGGSDMLYGGADAGGYDAMQRPTLGFGDLQPQQAQRPAAGGQSGGNGAVDVLVDRIIGVESAGNPNAKNPRSSAEGLGQFIDRTWLQTISKHRPDIARSMSRDQILQLKFNPTLSREMTKALARENEAFLSSNGHQSTPGNLYLAHFLGPGGANKTLSANPSAPIEAVVGSGPVRANPFLRGMTAGDVQAWAARKMGGRNPTMSSQGSARAQAPEGFQTRYGNVGFDGAGTTPMVTQAQYQPELPQGGMGGVNLPELPPQYRPQRSSREIMQFLNQYGYQLSEPQRAHAMKQLERAQMYEDPWGQLQLRRQYADAIGWKPQQADPRSRILTDEQERQHGLNPAGVYGYDDNNKFYTIQEAPKAGAADHPSSVQEYMFAQQQGYAGTYEDWKRPQPADPSSRVLSPKQERELGLNPRGVYSYDDNGKIYTIQDPPDADGEDGTEYGLNPQYGVDENGNPVIIQLGKDGTSTKTPLPPGVTFQKEPIRIDAGTKWVLLDPITRQPIGQIDKEIREAEAEKVAGKAEGEAALGAPKAIAQAQDTINLIDSIISDPNLAGITGNVQGRIDPEGPFGLLMSQDKVDLAIKVKQLQGKAFLEAFESLKGGGQITEREGAAAQAAMARLQRVQSDEDYRAALMELRSIAERGIRRAQGSAGPQAQTPQAQTPPAQAAPQRRKGNPFAKMSATEIFDFMQANPVDTLDPQTRAAAAARLRVLRGNQ